MAPDLWWSLPPDELLAAMQAGSSGLSRREAGARLRQLGPAGLAATRQATALRLFARQFGNPLVLILVAASLISVFAGEWVDAAVVLAIVLGSTVLGFVQEYMAGSAIE
ncbi:MAG TPA: cation-transporting P-type ATPase, partial [Rubrivivax sp.]|nr:cation-transporting P-type ATPase [Rubrivivax sp.]